MITIIHCKITLVTDKKVRKQWLPLASPPPGSGRRDVTVDLIITRLVGSDPRWPFCEPAGLEGQAFVRKVMGEGRVFCGELPLLTGTSLVAVEWTPNWLLSIFRRIMHTC